MTDEYDVWTCQDGREIPVTEMGTDHLVNAINFIDRKEKTVRDMGIDHAFGDYLEELDRKRRSLKAELKRRAGDGVTPSPLVTRERPRRDLMI